MIRDKDGLTLLHISALNRYLEVVIVQVSSVSRDVNKGIEVRIAGTRHDDVEAETNIDSKDFRGRTALSCASEQGNRDIVELFADRYNAKVDLRENNSITPLAEAAFRGHTEVVKTSTTRRLAKLPSRQIAKIITHRSSDVQFLWRRG